MPTILDPISHISVSNCESNTIALSVITDCLICTKFLRVFNLNHNRVYI